MLHPFYIDEDSRTKEQLKKRNETKREFYEMFQKKIELEIIDMVFSNCKYNSVETFEHLLVIAGQANKSLDVNPLNKHDDLYKTKVEIQRPLNLLDQFSTSDSSKKIHDIDPFFQHNQNSVYCPQKDGDSFERFVQDVQNLILVIMRGLPGAGKSTKARQLRGANGLLYSTDDYFFDKNNRYFYDRNQLSDAHTWNQKRTKRSMAMKVSPIIIDNTNMMAWEMKPYVAMALTHDYDIFIIEPDTSWAWKPSELAKRNAHGVSKETIERMKEKYEKNVTVENIIKNFNLVVPPYYKKKKLAQTAFSLDTDSSKVVSDKKVIIDNNEQYNEYGIPQNNVNSVEKSEVISKFEDIAGKNVPSPSSKTATNSSHGKIEDIVTALKTWCFGFESSPGCIIEEPKNKNENIPLKTMNESNFLHEVNRDKELFEFNIKFLTECFPLQDENYLRNCLLHSDGNLLKTCDYLCDLTNVSVQLDKLDKQLIDVNDCASYNIPSTSEQSSAMHNGEENFYIDIKKGKDVNIVIDPRLGIELFKRFGSPDDIDSFDSNDFVMELNTDLGRQLYSSWQNSVKKRKSTDQTTDQTDSQYGQQGHRTDKTEYDDGNYKKKQKMVPVGYSYLKDTEMGILNGDGWYNQHSKFSYDMKIVTDSSGKQLTAKQINIREELYKKFPGVDRDALNEVLESCGYCLQASISLVNSSCNLKNGVINVYAKDWKKGVEHPSHKQTIKSEENVKVENKNNDVFQKLSEKEQDYDDLRAEAYQYAKLRAECFQKAGKAFQEKNGPTSQHYADQGRFYTAKMKEAHARAAKIILDRRNKKISPDIIDLHGLHVDEGIKALKMHIQDSKSVGMNSITVITGWGAHSKNSRSPLREAVLMYLQKSNYRFEQRSGGGEMKVFI